jgi:hypothetical protein
MRLTDKISDNQAIRIAQLIAFECEGTRVLDRIFGVTVAICGKYSNIEVHFTDSESGDGINITYHGIDGYVKITSQDKIVHEFAAIGIANVSFPFEDEKDWFFSQP